ncbi:dTDP-glucose 4,6-dehydratase [Kaustia mangrovi]|uniref:dTDP-glucose 4,6-dehydratase n=1 Tax=Kaustia mangrovi TaxID=2593653 RepID=A0A7S8C4F4_9HYPH|nr:dTDP-glucose 4,6-dehydratase [Kaustia mangrovi]QPC43132.1 dTDP-glucose 4,6-dehydratase [Kaustia mangrovi]
MRIIVTGGAGFIGSAVCRAIVHGTRHRAVNIDKLTYAATPQSTAGLAGSPRYRFCRLDIGDRAGLQAVLADEEPDAIIHLAAESHVDRSIEGPAAFIETNIVGTYTLLEAARRYWSGLPDTRRERFRVLHVSTDEVYGSLGPDDGTFTEASPYDPSSPYSASKASADHLAMAWQRTYGLPVIVSNCSNNYGPFQFPEKLVPVTIVNALDGMDLPIYGRGDNVRDWLHVEDHARALLALLARGRPGERYTVGGRAERRNIDVVRAVCGLLDRLAPRSGGGSYLEQIAFVADRAGHDFRYAIDPGRIEDEIGWRALEDFSSGLERTVRWYLDNEAWWRPLRQAGAAGRGKAAAPVGRAAGAAGVVAQGDVA